MLTLTTEIIKADIAIYWQRIDAALSAIAELPGGQLPYPEHKKREQQRRALYGGISHNETLTRSAEEALAGLALLAEGERT